MGIVIFVIDSGAAALVQLIIKLIGSCNMADQAETAQWYVVHTYSGYENKVKVNLEKSVENNGLQDLIQEVDDSD